MAEPEEVTQDTSVEATNPPPPPPPTGPTVPPDDVYPPGHETC